MPDSRDELVELVRQVRHDANGPLTAALGNVQLLLEDFADGDPDTVETLRDVEAELRRLGEIIRRLGAVRRA